MVRVGAGLWCHPISGKKQEQSQFVKKTNKKQFLMITSMVTVACWSLPLVVQGGGHGVKCGADGLGAVPDEEQLCQSLLSTLSCEAGLCVLVPTVLHRLF